uniref:CobW C-terminal domain-containing protein n=1 Tax=Odontella aurita TaxID=265563 RepID=A0A7S4MRX7_9STRA
MDVDQVDNDNDDDEEDESGVSAGISNKKRKLEVATDDKVSLSHFATLDTLVTVVDSLNIYDVLGSIETLADENNISGMLGNTGAASAEADEDVCVLNSESDGEQDEGNEAEAGVDDRPVSQLWLDQIEFANVIVVSKASILLKNEGKENGGKKLAEIEALLEKLNPKAKIIVPREDKYGDLDVSKTLINTGLFDMEEASASAGWQEELKKEDHNPETEEYSISSTVFHANERPFHPDRLNEILNGFGDYGSALSPNNSTTDGEDDVFRGVVRSKGQLWLANTNAYPIDFHSAGAHIDIRMNEEEMPFLAAISRSEWEKEEEETYKTLVNGGKWSDDYGDRRSELVFIGVRLNKARIHEKLTSALLTDDETANMAGWKKLNDPFFGGTAENHFELPPPYGCR